VPVLVPDTVMAFLAKRDYRKKKDRKNDHAQQNGKVSSVSLTSI
jgi:hypothetical protein